MPAIFMISTIVSAALTAVNVTLSKSEIFDREKPSPFECGYDPMTSARLPFSLHFFLISVIFLIFDVEITLMLPSIPSTHSHDSLILPNLLSLFILILIAGLAVEWHQGSLDWLT